MPMRQLPLKCVSVQLHKQDYFKRISRIFSNQESFQTVYLHCILHNQSISILNEQGFTGYLEQKAVELE